MTFATTATCTSTTQSEPAYELAQLTLSVGVPIEIDHLIRQCGPNDYQCEAAQRFVEQQALSEAILFVSKGETSE